MLHQAADVRNKARAAYERACRQAGQAAETLSGPAQWQPAGDRDGLLAQAAQVGIARRLAGLGPDLGGLGELLTYGLKGTAAYADHAQILGQQDDDVYAFFHEALDFLTRDGHSADDYLAQGLRCGEVNLKVMGLLDSAHTAAFGPPDADARPRYGRGGQGDRRLRPRSERPGRRCSSKPPEKASTSTRTARCCPRTATRG